MTSTVFSFFATPPSKFVQFFPKLSHTIFGPRRIEMTEQNFLTYWWKKKLWCCVGNKVDPKLFQRLYLCQTWSIDTKLGMLHRPWTEDICQSWTAPPMGREIPKMHNFAYNFWMHCFNCVISLSFNSLDMPILTMSHLSFSMNVPVSHIEVNEKQCFCYSSFKFCPFCPKSNHMIFGPTCIEMTEQIFDICYRSREIPLWI